VCCDRTAKATRSISAFFLPLSRKQGSLADGRRLAVVVETSRVAGWHNLAIEFHDCQVA